MSDIFYNLRGILRTNRFKYLFSLISISSLFVSYQINLSYILTGNRLNNFLDIVVSLPLVVIIGFAIFVIFFSRLKHLNLIRFYLIFSFFGVIYYIISKGNFSNINVYTLIYQSFVTSSIVISWIYLAIKSASYFKNSLLPVVLLFIASSFDYYLITDFNVLVFAISIFTFLTSFQSNSKFFNRLYLSLVSGYLLINFGLGLFQILNGKDLGLKYLGEINLSYKSFGVAKLEFFNNVYLRPYGLMIHSNLLGFLGVVSAFIFTRSEIGQNYYLKQSLYLISILLIFLSFSRMALLSFVVMLSYDLFKNINLNEIASLNFSKISNYFKKNFLLIIAFCIPVLSLILLFINRLKTSDIYRFADFNRFIELSGNLSLDQILFGTFIGSYPFLLKDNFVLENWQYQPVHNVFLNFVIWSGIVPLLLLIIYLYFSTKNKQNFSLDYDYVYATSFYDIQDINRRNEIKETLIANSKLNFITQTIIFSELEDNTELLGIKNLKIIRIKKRPTFATFVDFYNQNLKGKTMIFGNSDILLTNSLKNSNKYLAKNKIIALTRYEDTGTLSGENRDDLLSNKYYLSSDIWLINAVISPSKLDITLGVPGCDNRINYELFDKGFEILNPAKNLITRHIDSKAVKSWGNDQKLSGFLLFNSLDSDGIYQVIYH